MVKIKVREINQGLIPIVNFLSWQYLLYKIKGYGKITEDNISEVTREIRLALLEADVNYLVVKDFVNKGLSNLTIFVDFNGLQIDGAVKDVMNVTPIKEKFEAFGWNVIEICGHCFCEIEEAFEKAKECKGKPTCIVAETVKGKGVSFMENQVSWHGSAPNAEQYEEAMAELNAKLKELEA